ncbi:hypothetical protein METH_19885 [Leisingera methylohalidivorans DSM 14336]|uniref:Uncharacterized protein n=1 Tax=Leisingera methylohalidivorans DSM 14336 TaxID=999552 RepID=V9VZV6_9RHOB|nr:hypothetical protein METH_19885 [Leisingera methylohalidivorans DSM 14336]
MKQAQLAFTDVELMACMDGEADTALLSRVMVALN